MNTIILIVTALTIVNSDVVSEQTLFEYTLSDGITLEYCTKFIAPAFIRDLNTDVTWSKVKAKAKCVTLETYNK